MFLKNKNIIFKIRISKVTDYAALKGIACGNVFKVPEYLRYTYTCILVKSSNRPGVFY